MFYLVRKCHLKCFQPSVIDEIIKPKTLNLQVPGVVMSPVPLASPPDAFYDQVPVFYLFNHILTFWAGGGDQFELRPFSLKEGAMLLHAAHA